MSSTWRYVSEARGHLVELYELLLDAPLDRVRRYDVGFGASDLERMNAESAAAKRWDQERLSTLMAVVDVLKTFDVKRAIVDWRPHAIDFLGKTPSAREKKKFADAEDRILFLCVALWYARVAVEWLEVREDEGLLQGGIGYRAMTARAALLGSVHERVDENVHKILPEESNVVDGLDEHDERLAAYQDWTYIVIDIEGF